MNVFSHEMLVENSSILMEAVGSSQMLVHMYQITWHHVLEDSNIKRYTKPTVTVCKIYYFLLQLYFYLFF
jgi:hypothetical protein